jgi:uncharacterized protein involved in exopolysaccharide biosynthesis
LPDETGRSEDQQYRAELDLESLEQGLRSAQERESLLAIQLASTSPNLLSAQALANAQGARNLALPEGLTDLATVKTLLADAEVRYTPDHPDVKRLKRALAVLEARKEQRGARAVEADNPDYRRISSELAAARADVAARQSDITRARARLQRYSANLNPSVGLAEQVAELERRRATLRAQFQDVQGKLTNAQQGQIVEADPHAEHFTLLRAPTAAKTPYSPNRLGVILLGLVLGCGIAVLVVWVIESADDTVRGVRDVAALGSIPLLGSISEIRLPSEVRRGRLIWGSVSALYVLAAIFVTVAVIQAQVHQDLVQKSSTMNRASQ